VIAGFGIRDSEFRIRDSGFGIWDSGSGSRGVTGAWSSAARPLPWPSRVGVLLASGFGFRVSDIGGSQEGGCCMYVYMCVCVCKHIYVYICIYIQTGR